MRSFPYVIRVFVVCRLTVRCECFFSFSHLWEEGSRDEEQNTEGDDDVEEVGTSGSRASAKPILRLPERNEEDTGHKLDTL
jgi:hypothetical protein